MIENGKYEGKYKRLFLTFFSKEHITDGMYIQSKESNSKFEPDHISNLINLSRFNYSI